jgi:hypothetical protein
LEDLGVDRPILFPASERNRMGGCGLDLSGKGQAPVMGCSKHNNLINFTKMRIS